MKRGQGSTSAVPAPSWVTPYVALVALASIGLAWYGWRFFAPPDWTAVAFLTLLCATGASLRERELGPSVGVSFATVVLAAAIALEGPGGAVVVGFVAYAADLRHQTLRTRLFNAAMAGAMGGVGGLLYVWSGGARPISAEITPGQIVLTVGVPLILGYVGMTLLNTLLIGVMVRLVRGNRVLSSTIETLRSLGLRYLVHVLLGLLLVILWEPAGVGPASAVLILGPLLLAQWTLSRDADERRIHARTVSTLMGALELANPYSVGHSARVADLCDRMAPGLGISGDDAETLHYAALLHDLGLMATAPRLPRGSGSVDITYLAAVVEHPEAGVRMLQDIDFLAPALPGILHHHERMDGRGYPAGITDAEIPLFARVIAVADAFDSLTTTRSYRSALTPRQGLDVLWSRVGTHLDPAVVRSLEEALQQVPWAPTVIADAVLKSTGDVYDHDDPEVSDQHASWQPDSEGSRP